MIRTHWRLWCCAGAAAGLAWTLTGSAQERPAQVAKTPKVNKQAAPATNAVDRFRRMEILVELAWLNDPVTFPYFLEAHVVGPSLVVRGAVPSAAVRVRAAQVAQLMCPLTVRDMMQERAGLAVRPTPRSPEQLKSAVESHLREAFPDLHDQWTVQCGNDGAVELKGHIESLEQKLALSQCLRRLHGCTRAVNLTGLPDVRDIRPATAQAPVPAAAPLAQSKPPVPPASVVNASAKEPAKSVPQATPLPRTAPKTESTIDKATPPNVFQTPASSGKVVEVVTLPAAPKFTPVKTSPPREQGHTTAKQPAPEKKTHMPIVIERHAPAPMQSTPTIATKGFALVEVETPRAPDKTATESSRGFVLIEPGEPKAPVEAPAPKPTPPQAPISLAPTNVRVASRLKSSPPPMARHMVEKKQRNTSEEKPAPKPIAPAPKTESAKVEASRGFVVIESADPSPPRQQVIDARKVLPEPQTTTLPAPAKAAANHTADQLTKCIHDTFPGRRYVKVTFRSATELRIDVNAEPLENVAHLGERMMALPELSGYLVDLHIFVYGRKQ
ncbi:MAG: hypothetical protein L0Y72_28860 [Gemmataceae bacterium]|nr:hypothetical protein [Gemmataceae bacterium]